MLFTLHSGDDVRQRAYSGVEMVRVHTMLRLLGEEQVLAQQVSLLCFQYLVDAELGQCREGRIDAELQVRA